MWKIVLTTIPLPPPPQNFAETPPSISQLVNHCLFYKKIICGSRPLQGSIQDLSFGGEVPSNRRRQASKGGGGGGAEIFGNEYVLRCNLVRFET